MASEDLDKVRSALASIECNDSSVCNQSILTMHSTTAGILGGCQSGKGSGIRQIQREGRVCCWETH